MRLLYSLLLVFVSVAHSQISADSSAAKGLAEEQRHKIEKLKKEFENVLAQFEDQESAQLCVAIAGKADINFLLNRVKKNAEWTGLEKQRQGEVAEND